MKTLPASLLSLSLLVLAACAPATRLITKPSTASLTPSAGQATILIGHTMSYKALNILDGSGNVIGQMGPREHTVIHVSPGPVKIYAVPENRAKWGDRVEGTVEAGKVYYLSASMRWGGIGLTVIKPTDAEGWPTRKTYETDLATVELDSSQLAGLNEDLGDKKEITSTIDEVVASFDADEKKARTLNGADGE